MRTASIDPAARDALLEAWQEATCTLSHLRALAIKRASEDPDDQLAGYVLILTADV